MASPTCQGWCYFQARPRSRPLAREGGVDIAHTIAAARQEEKILARSKGGRGGEAPDKIILPFPLGRGRGMGHT